MRRLTQRDGGRSCASPSHAAHGGASYSPSVGATLTSRRRQSRSARQFRRPGRRFLRSRPRRIASGPSPFRRTAWRLCGAKEPCKPKTGGPPAFPSSIAVTSFQRPAGGFERPSRPTQAFCRLARSVNISTERLHALRQTAASWLIASGVDAQTTASVLGHASGNVTLGIYSHLVAGRQQIAVANIDAAARNGHGGKFSGPPNGHRGANRPQSRKQAS